MRSSHFQEAINIQIQKVGNYDTLSLETRLMLNALALAGEAGEIANKVKKEVWSGGGAASYDDFRIDLGEELGDVLYHVAQLASELGFTMNDLMRESVAKTTRRNGEVNAKN